MSGWCPWCGRTAITTLDGMPACARCSAENPPPAAPMTLEMRVFRIVDRNPGISSFNVWLAMEAGDDEHAAVNQHLRRLVASGAIRVEVLGNFRFFYALDASKVRVDPTPHIPDEECNLRTATQDGEGGCVECHVGLLPEWGDRCPECKEEIERRLRRLSRSRPGEAQRIRRMVEQGSWRASQRRAA